MADTRVSLRFKPEWRITLFTLVMVPLMVGLGLWQLQRAAEKAALSASWEARRHQQPVPLADLLGAPAGRLAYRRVALEGSFREEYFLLDNRIQGGRFGYEVLGVFALQGGGAAGSPTAVLVNRGWIAGDPARLTLPAVPPVPGAVRLTGHVYVAPGEPYLLAEQRLTGSWPELVQAVQMDKLAPAVEALTGGTLFPFAVRLDAEQPGALAIDWQIVNVTPEKHRAYAVQWFTMAAVLLLFYLLRCSNLWQLLRGRGAEVK